MECSNCELKHQQFYCENCLRSHLRDFRLQTQRFVKERDHHVAQAKSSLAKITPARQTRANLASVHDKLDEATQALSILRQDNDAKRERIRARRAGLVNRRNTLLQATAIPMPLVPADNNEVNNLSTTIARARSGLVQELMEVFNVVEVGGRPPIGGKAGSNGEWTIGGLILPVPGDIRRYPPEHSNAVLTHTIHFLSLLTFYLGVKLPFEITWTGKILGVGQPWIGATKGGESGGWAKWHVKHPLHLSSTTPAPPPTHQSRTIPENISTTESYIEHGPEDPRSESSFTTALAMLLYNVAYLAHTQTVDIPLSHAGDVLRNLWIVCCSPDLGRQSHETVPRLPAPTPPSFPLEFSQLLQVTTANPTSRARSRVHSRPKISTKTSSRKQTKIVEEEDGWDLVEDHTFGDFS